MYPAAVAAAAAAAAAAARRSGRELITILINYICSADAKKSPLSWARGRSKLC